MRDWLTHLPYVTRQSWPNPSRTLDFYPAGRQTVAPRVIVNHSTETITFPGYNGGAAAPHFTGSLAQRVARQHVPLSYGSRCLAVSTKEDYRNVWHTDRTVNITGVIQIEWVGAVTPGYPRKYGHYDIPNIAQDEDAMRFVGRMWADIHLETGIPLSLSNYGTWIEYPGSYGVTADQRLNSAQFRDARGLLGHQHVPANNHGDGLLGRAVNGRAVDMEAILDIARDMARSTTPLPVPSKPAPDPHKGFELEHLERVESLLDVLGYEGADVWARTLAYQKDHGLTPLDGLPGPQTTAHLEAFMSDVIKRLERIEAKLDNAPERVWSHVLYGFAAHWWLRRGSLGKATTHRNFPADPGSPADVEMRVAEKVLGEDVTPYTGEQTRKA